MFRRICMILACFAPSFLSANGFAQAADGKATEPPPMAMPADREADSYRIYQSLLPLGETAGTDWPHALWLVQDTTVSPVPANEPCQPVGGSKDFDMGMNPHVAIHPPEDSRSDFAEILEDFDRHCHDRLSLDADAWKPPVPVHLLNTKEQDEFRKSRMERSAAAQKYKGAAALYGFSEVYFNRNHTVAMVYATHWCGNLCGQGFWLAFALEKDEWKPLRWRSDSWIS